MDSENHRVSGDPEIGSQYSVKLSIHVSRKENWRVYNYNKCIYTHFIISDQKYWFRFFGGSCENAGAF